MNAILKPAAFGRAQKMIVFKIDTELTGFTDGCLGFPSILAAAGIAKARSPAAAYGRTAAKPSEPNTQRRPIRAGNKEAAAAAPVLIIRGDRDPQGANNGRVRAQQSP